MGMTRNPDKIKKGLECRLAAYTDSCTLQCATCPHYIPAYNAKERTEDVIALIRQLQDENTEKDQRIQQLEAERDAAVADLRQASIYLCCACKKYHHAVRGVSHHYCEVIGERADFAGAISCGMFEWRGVQKEE